MKKNMVLLVLGSLLCPMVLATAESVVDNRQSTLESKDELSITTSSEMPEFTEAIESSSSEVEEVERTILSTSSSEEESLEERIERILKEATTPEEYQEVLEYIKQTTDYNQVEKNDIDSYSFKSSVNRASQAKGVAEFLGISKQQLLNELQAHEYDNFYLGTPFRGLWTPSVQCMSPNGAPNRYGPGFNCTGFVATAFQRAGGDLRRITNVANAWGDVCNAYNWRDALRPNTEHYAFNSVNELLASGKAEKGDVIYFEPDYTAPNFDCHIGFFWGSRSNENLMWHSYDRNIKSNIKSATPFTKIYLFKLGNDKNAVIHDKKMNHKRFIEKTSASVYSRPYQSGDKSIDTTKGLYHQEVLVTREVRNGHGTWQEITYKNNNRTKKGWIQSGEMSDVINKASYKKRLAIRSNKADLYKDPYIPGVKTVSVLQNKKTLPVSISQKATTGYGEWYKVSFIDGKAERNGWMKSTDFAAIVNQQKIEKEVTVNKDYGAIYNAPYTGSVDDKQVDLTTELVNKEIPVLEEAYTGYGHWYRIDTTIDNVVYQGWIKETDVEDYIGYENVTGRMLINKNYGSVYDSPYVEGKTKQVDNLNGMLNEIVTISAKANTNKGTWYQVKYTKNKKTSKGWIKSLDLVDIVEQQNISKKMTINKNHGSIYDKPYTSPDVTQEIGKTDGLKDFEITVIEEAKTGYGQWYRTEFELEDRLVNGWIKQTDLEEYFNYQILDTQKTINKNYGSVYDSPYVAGHTKQIEKLNGLENEVVEVSAVAETDYGVWFESTYKSKDKSFKGWIKSKDLK